MERISLDKHYLDSLVFKINNSQSGRHAGLELSAESRMIRPEIVEESLKTFTKGLSGRKGIERNIWVKKFIEKIRYGKDEIELSLYYQGSSEKASETQIPSGRVGPSAQAIAKEEATAGINKDFGQKESAVFHGASSNLAPDSNSIRTINIILPNLIHKCRKKNL